jgi:hypothetical protein
MDWKEFFHLFLLKNYCLVFFLALSSTSLDKIVYFSNPLKYKILQS